MLFEGILLNIIIVFAFIVIAVIAYCKWAHKYWERLGVPSIETTIPFGTVPNIFFIKNSFGEEAAKQYLTAKSKGYKHVGLYGFARPEYMPIDLELLKNIIVKDFNYFTDRGLYINEEHDPLSGNIFWLTGAKWKMLRSKVTPTFSSGKVKTMFSTIVQCGHQLKQFIDSHHEQEPMDAKKFLELFGIDVIGSCAFGLDCNSFTNPNSDFRKYSKRFFSQSILENMRSLTAFFFPFINDFFKLKVVPSDISNFFLATVRNTIEYRKINNIVRNDFLQLLLDLKKDGSDLAIEEITAHAFSFFLAGFETTSTSLVFTLLELSLNEDIQEKLRKEVLEHYTEELTYEDLNKMVYMRQVLDESLRKYAPIPIINRLCIMDYKVPNTDLVLKKGTRIIISALGLHHDPEYFPSPEKFDPERFSAENRSKINPFSYMPFGEGPRICIGVRFAFTAMKIALAILIKNFKFSLNEKTQFPPKMNIDTFVLSTSHPIWLNVEKI